VIDEYKHKDDFDPTKSDTYKNDLYCFIDDQLQQKFNQLCPVVLSAVHQEACNSIVSAYSQLLNEPLNQMVDTYKLDPPEVTHNVRCRDLCGNFREDLEFRFTLGIFSLMKWVNAGNIMYSVQRRLSGVTSVVPAELLVPVSLLGGGIILSRLLSWHYLWPPTLIYVGIYAYEHFTWTDKAKENRLKKQLAGHLTKEFNKEVLAVKTSFKNVLLNDLHRLIDRLNLSFNSTQNDCEGAIADLRDEEHQLGLLQGQIRTLRNSVILIKRDMDNFKDEYLD
jgi:mitofusin